MAYMKNGRFEFSDVKDNKKMQKVFEGASLKQLELAMLIGVFALFLTAFGYIGVSKIICYHLVFSYLFIKYKPTRQIATPKTLLQLITS